MNGYTFKFAVFFKGRHLYETRTAPMSSAGICSKLERTWSQEEKTLSLKNGRQTFTGLVSSFVTIALHD